MNSQGFYPTPTHTLTLIPICVSPSSWNITSSYHSSMSVWYERKIHTHRSLFPLEIQSMQEVQIGSDQHTDGLYSSDMCNITAHTRRNWATAANTESQWILSEYHQKRHPGRRSDRSALATTTRTSNYSPQKENILHMSLFWPWNSDSCCADEKSVSETASTHWSSCLIQEATQSEANLITDTKGSRWFQEEQTDHPQGSLQELWSCLHWRDSTRPKQKDARTSSSD